MLRKGLLSAAVTAMLIALAIAQPAQADDAERLLSVDHFVRVQSTAPAISGQTAQIYVREVVRAAVVTRDAARADRVVLFVHGGGTPGSVSFDVPFQDYSWMAYLARAGFDVFAMDMTGYGRSTRPLAMNDPCNLSPKQQAALPPGVIQGGCAPSYRGALTTIASDWNDLATVVDHVLELRHVDQISLIGWSSGGARAGGFAVQHPEKVRTLVLLAPDYNRGPAQQPPAQMPAAGAPMSIQSREGLTALWNYQVGCPGQYDPAIIDAVWSAMIESDPVGATWGTGVRRAPQVMNEGWNQSDVARTTVPTLMVTGEQDKLVPSARVRDLYTDLGSKNKVMIELACSSHFGMWERNHPLLFRASLEWLTKGTVNGQEQGTLHLGN